MIVCAAVVIASPAMAEDADTTAPTVPTFSGADTATVGTVAELEALTYYHSETDVFTVPSQGLVLTLTNDITIADMQILLNGNLKITGGYTLQIGHAVSAPGESIIRQGENVSAQVVIDGQGTELVTNISNASNYSPGANGSNATLRVDGLFILNGGSVEINQPATVSGQTWWTGENYNLYMDNGTMNLNASGLSGVVLWMKNGSSLNVSNNQASTVTINNGSTIEDSEVTVSKPAGVDRDKSSRVFISGTVNLSNSSIEMNGTAETVRDINFVAGATVNMDSTSSLTSPNFDMASSSGTTVTINGGTMNGQFVDGPGGTVTYTLSGTTVTKGAADGASIIIGTGGLIVDAGAGNTAEFPAGVLTANSNNYPVIVKSGTLNVTDSNVLGTNVVISENASAKQDGTEIKSEDSIDVKDMPSLAAAAEAGVPIDVTAEITLTDNITLAEGAYFVKNESAGAINVANYSIINTNGGFNYLKVKSTTNGETNFAYIQLNGDFTISKGSVKVNGAIIDSSEDGQENLITPKNGTVTVSGNLSGTLTFDMSTLNTSVNVVFEDFTVNAGATLILVADPNTGDAKSVSYYTSGTFSLYGNLISNVTPQEDPVVLNVGYVSGNVGLTASFDSQFTAYPGAVISQNVTLVKADSEESTINLDDSLRNMDIAVDVTGHQVYSQMQNVTIVTSLNITPYASLTIMGKLIINEGVTLTIQGNGKLIIDSNTARMIVDGTIEVENGGTITVIDADTVTVSGSISSEGSVEINSDVTVEDGGSIYIDDAENSDFVVTEGLTVDANGSVEVRGEMAVLGITNKGAITLNGATLVSRNVGSTPIVGCTISMAADGAVVDIRSFTSETDDNTLTITDRGLVLVDRDTADVTVGGSVEYETYTYSKHNEIRLSGDADVGLRNLTVTETVTSEQDRNDNTKFTYGMNIAGSPAVVDDRSDNDADINNAAEVTITLDGINFNVVADSTLTLGAGVTVALDDVDTKMTVAGTITAINGGDSNPCAITNTVGTIDVSGMIQTLEDKEIDKINAAHYTAEVSGITYNYYTTLATAITNEADTIYIMGEITILENVTIPTDVTVRAEGSAVMNIGDADHRDVVVSVTAGATVRGFTSGGYIDVYGTLEFADSGDSKGSNVIYSDVSVSADPAITYTNIYTALNGAEDGETVTITRTTTPVILDDDLSVRTGVTLVIPSNATVQIDDDVTFTIDGTVQKIGAIASTSTDGFNPLNSDNTEKDADAYAVVIVNGALMSRGQQVDYATDSTTGVVGYYIPGAYYRIIDTTGDWYYVTPVAQAATVSNDVYQGAIAINGENTVGDVDFTGDAQQAVTVTLNEDASLEAGSVTLSYARIVITVADTVFDGTVDTAVGSIEFENITNVTVEDSFDDETEVMSVTGTPGAADDKVDAVMTVATGNVTVTGANLDVSSVDEFSIASGATLTVTGSGVVFSANWMTVDGTLVVTDNGKIDANRVTVRGTLTAESRTADHNAGSAEIGELYVGIAVNDRNDFELVDASAATVSADAIDQMTYMIVSADSTVSGGLIENLAATEYYVEDALWVTVYGTYEIAFEVTSGTGSDAVTNTLYNIQPGDLAESAFVSWTDADGRDVPAGTANGADGYEQVYASIDYDVYIVIVMTDNSIGSVAIDGQMLVYNYNIGGYIVPEMYLDAGQHTVTYTLAAGYEGTPTLTSNGVNATVSGMGFTLSGDYQDANGSINYNYLALGGATYSGSTVVIDGGNGGSNDMGLTDYLLIVLVILIVIMAIIVALRLMRS